MSHYIEIHSNNFNKMTATAPQVHAIQAVLKSFTKDGKPTIIAKDTLEQALNKAKTEGKLITRQAAKKIFSYYRQEFILADAIKLLSAHEITIDEKSKEIKRANN